MDHISPCFIQGFPVIERPRVVWDDKFECRVSVNPMQGVRLEYSRSINGVLVQQTLVVDQFFDVLDASLAVRPISQRTTSFTHTPTHT